MATKSQQSNVSSLVQRYRGSKNTIALKFDNASYHNIISDKELKMQSLVMEGVELLDPNHGARNKMFESVDKLLYEFIKGTKSKEVLAAAKKEITKAGKLSFIPTPDPLTLGRSEDLIAYITDTFILRDPVFEVPPIPNLMHVSTAIEDYFRKQSQIHKWRPTLTKSVQNSVWYNFGPAMLDSFYTGDTLKIKALSPYDTRYDSSVRLEDIADKAMMVASTESVSVVEVMENLNLITDTYLTNWGVKCKGSPAYIMKADQEYAGLQVHVCAKYKREFNDQYSAGQSRTNWNTLTEDGTKRKAIEDAKDSAASVTRSIIYRRLQPSWFGLNTDVYADDSSGKIPVYRFTYVNGTLLAVEPLTSSPYSIPMYIGSCHLDTQSELPYTFTERLGPLQAYNDKLNDARLEAVKDALSLLEVMDDDMIEEISNDGSKAYKIKSKSRKDTNFSVDQAYRQYRPDTQGITGILQFQSDVDAMITNATGDNRMLRGDHIPGNRTSTESSRILKTSESRVVLRSFAMQATLIEPLQQDIQKRLASNVSLLRYYEPNTGKILAVTSEEFTVAQHFFEVSDGLLPSSLNVSPEAAQALMTMVVQVPAMQEMFDLRTLANLFAGSLGLKGVSKIPTPSVAQQEIQQRLQALLADPNAQQGDPNAPADPNASPPPPEGQPPTAPNVQGQPQQ